MNDLNEKLAELCGLTLGYNPMCGNIYRNAEGLTMYEEADWNPTTDLNQLRIVARVALDSISNDAADIFTEALKQVYVEMTDSDECGEIALALMWIDRPELVAQAILKAKEVS